MSEDKIKLKYKINNIPSDYNKINIPSQSEQNSVQIVQNSINIDINNIQNIHLPYGTYKIFLYNSKGDPLFLIGPDYSYFISMLIMNLIYTSFFTYLYITITNFYIALIGVILNIIQLLSFVLACIKNPGLPKKELQNEILLSKDPDKYVRCRSCSFIIDKSKNFYHCDICKCCCEGYDHHCPWTSKCVGKGNIFYFNAMLVMVSIIFIYVIFAFVFTKPKKGKKLL